MFESISRSITLFRISWGILMEDKRLLAFPLLTGIVLLIMLAVLLLPLFVGSLAEAAIPGGAVVMYAILFAAYLAFYFIVIFFNTALISCADARLSGRDMSVGEGISNALSHFTTILGWALVSATVGLILSIISQRGGVLGKIAITLVGFAWNVGTYFVIPVFVLEGKGVSDSLRESIALIRKTWGESIIGFESVSLVMSFIIGIAIAVTIVLIVVGGMMHLQGNTILVILALGVSLCIILAVIASAMQGIYITALYTYARTGTVPSAFRTDLIQNAFVQK
jgi:hypothetical protein